MMLAAVIKVTSEMFACFTCRRKANKKKVGTEKAEQPTPRAQSSEDGGLRRSLTLGTTQGVYRTASRSQSKGKAPNRPLREYQFPRTKSMMQLDGEEPT